MEGGRSKYTICSPSWSFGGLFLLFDIVAKELRLCTFHRLVTWIYWQFCPVEYITTAENNCGEHECMEVKDFVISLLPNVFRGNISIGNLGRASAGQLSAFIATSIYLVAVVAPPSGNLVKQTTDLIFSK